LSLVRYVVFHPWRAAAILVVGTVFGLGAFYAYQVSTALGAVAVEDFNPEAARVAMSESSSNVIGTPPSTYLDFYDEPTYDVDTELERIAEQMASLPDTGTFNLAAYGEPIDDELFEAYLLVGTDASGFLADAIILALQPSTGAPPIMVSLPRDLYVWNLCKQTFTRLNSGLGGCTGVATGSELLAVMVEDYTGIPVDHLARINFSGFARVVDVLGGITVCVNRPTRDQKAHLLIEHSGCHRVDGETALAWVRSRHPEELVGPDTWVAVSGSDFTRQRRQQDVLFQLAGRAAGFSSPTTLTNKLSAVASSVRLDSSWSFAEAVGTAWRYRGITKDDVHRFSVSVHDYRTSYGAQVLLTATSFKQQLSEVYDFD
jgi:LCP family protein required for cell wall assembly